MYIELEITKRSRYVQIDARQNETNDKYSYYVLTIIGFSIIFHFQVQQNHLLWTLSIFIVIKGTNLLFVV